MWKNIKRNNLRSFLLTDFDNTNEIIFLKMAEHFIAPIERISYLDRVMKLERRKQLFI